MPQPENRISLWSLFLHRGHGAEDIWIFPVLLGLAYVGAGYVSWVVAEALVGREGWTATRLLLTPAVASCAMTAWDLAMDPVWANVDRAWIWRDGGGWFGVPLSNYFGWLLTTWVFYQAFALILARHGRGLFTPQWSQLAILMYATIATGNIFLALPSAVPSSYPRVVIDAAGRQWALMQVIEVCLLISFCVMTRVRWQPGRVPGTSHRAKTSIARDSVRMLSQSKHERGSSARAVCHGAAGTVG